MGPLDSTDLAIVAALVEDGRMSMNELAQRVNVSRATAYARLDRLREQGVITGFTALVDRAKLGLPIAALILLDVEQHEWRELSDELRRLPGFDYLAVTSGEFDMVMLVRAPDIESLRDVVLTQLATLPRIRSTR